MTPTWNLSADGKSVIIIREATHSDLATGRCYTQRYNDGTFRVLVCEHFPTSARS